MLANDEPVRFSRLKLMGLSPAHYAAAHVAETPAMSLGTAAHALVLGTAEVIPYEGIRRGAEWQRFKDEHQDCEILPARQYEQAKAMAESVLRHPEAVRLLDGEHEREIEWSFCGRSCVSHLDVLGRGGEWIVDLKTARTAKPERFSWSARTMAYHSQLAFYAQAVVASGLCTPAAAYIVAVESVAPYVVTVYRLTPNALDLGLRLCRLWMERLLACEAAGRWPGYCEAIVDLDVPDDECELVFGGEIEAAAGSEPF